MKISKRILYGSLIVGAFASILSLGGRGVVAEAAASQGYYANVDKNLKGDAFLSNLQTIISAGAQIDRKSVV